MIGIGIGIPGLRVGGGGLDPDALTLIAAMSVQPDGARQQLINTTIKQLKAAGIWALLDELWMLAAHDSQAALLGWKRYRDCTAVNAPTWTTDRGYQGDGATSYLDTGYVPSTDGVQYKLDDASFGAYSRRNVSRADTDMGCRDSNDIYNHYESLSGSGWLARINGSSSPHIATNNDSRGLHLLRRAAAESFEWWRNGTQLSVAMSQSIALPQAAIYIGARHNGSGVAERYATRQYAMAFVGASLSEQQQADLYTITQAYLTSLGAAV